MVRATSLYFLVSLLGLTLTACEAEQAPRITYDPASLRFSGGRALQLEKEFVLEFPGRHSGQPNNHRAAAWLMDRVADLGLQCELDKWEIINYNRPVALNNVVCQLPGESDKEILVVAHLDQAPTTVQGADNDGSGIAILLELVEIFAAEPTLPYSLAFVATDAEEYGMIGSGRYINTHPDPGKVVAAMSLDNLGRTYYDGMNMELVGQFKGYGPLWLALTARQAARAAGTEWDVNLRAPLDQVTDQAAPVSFMDQGPLVAAGVPAIGLAAHVPPSFAGEHFDRWHDPRDTLDAQSAHSLEQSGLIAEALIRQLASMRAFPSETGPYLYFDAAGQVLRGAPLWAIFIVFVGLFFLGSFAAKRGPFGEMIGAWRSALPHFTALWLPLVASILLLYGMVAVGLMDTYAVYPATSKDPILYHPRWPAVILFLVGTAVFLYVGRRAVHAARRVPVAPKYSDIRSLCFLVLGLSGAYIVAVNPFGLLFMVPLLFWFLIRNTKGIGRALNLLLFLLGGLVVYALVYIFGFTVLHLDFAFLWYLLNMFSIGTIRFPMAAVIMAIIAAGLAMVVEP